MYVTYITNTSRWEPVESQESVWVLDAPERHRTTPKQSCNNSSDQKFKTATVHKFMVKTEKNAAAAVYVNPVKSDT